MKYPMLNISDKDWKEDEDLTVYMLFDEFIYTNREDIFVEYYKDKKYCDCKGDIYKIIDKRPPISFWRNVFRFLPNVFKVELRLIPTRNKMTVEELRSFMLERLENLDNSDFVVKWIDFIKNAKSHEDIIDSKIK